MKLFRSNIGRLQRVRTDIKNSFDHKCRVILSQDNQGTLKLAEQKITEAIILLNKIQRP